MLNKKPPLDPLISAPDSNEYFNAISHLIGAILSISALAVLVSLAAIAGKPAHVVGFAIYGVSLFLSFLFKKVFKKLRTLFVFPTICSLISWNSNTFRSFKK